MSEAQNWRTETNSIDYFGHQKKRVALNERKPVIRKASDLVGPGIGAQAVRLTNYSDLLATYNGFYASEAGATDAPTPDEAYVGFVSGDAELGGVQMFTNLETEVRYQRVFRRNPSDPATIYWGDWAVL